MWFPAFQSPDANKHGSQERYCFCARACKGKMGEHDRIFSPQSGSFDQKPRKPRNCAIIQCLCKASIDACCSYGKTCLHSLSGLHEQEASD